MVDVIQLIPSHIEIEYFQIDAQGHDLNVNKYVPASIAFATLACTQVVKSARHLIHRVARVMLEVDVVKGANPFFVGGSNKQVMCVVHECCPLLGHSQCNPLFDLAIDQASGGR
jgi:hypothetical protein